MARDESSSLLRFDVATTIPDLHVVALRGEEALSSLYAYEVDLLSSAPSLDPAEILGKAATIGIRVFDAESPAAEPVYRHINGMIRSFRRVRRYSPSLVVYQAVVVPWLWLLDQGSDCRIFHDTTLSDIVVDGVFGPHRSRLGAAFGGGWLDTSSLAAMTPFARDYCVQYEESDFAFASRLLEDEGVSYYFRHQPSDAAANVMVLCRGAVPFPACDDVTLPVRLGPPTLGLIYKWEESWNLRSGGWSCTDYDFFGASTLRHEGANTLNQPAMSGLHVFDYAVDIGRHGKAMTVEDLATVQRVRLEEQECGYAVAEAESGSARITPGLKLTVEDSGSNDVVAPSTWIVDRVSHTVEDWSAVNATMRPTYTNRFTCLPADTPIRPQRRTPKPRIHGWDTAIVVAGDDSVSQSAQVSSHDLHGRVRLRFNWDRESKSSCWVRVSQMSAGAGWGSLHMPHHGDEVLVAYQGGDPDRPMVVGRVYNGVNVPPVAIPPTDLHLTVQSDVAGNQTITGTKPGNEFTLQTDSRGWFQHTGNAAGVGFNYASDNSSINYSFGDYFAVASDHSTFSSKNGADYWTSVYHATKKVTVDYNCPEIVIGTQANNRTVKEYVGLDNKMTNTVASSTTEVSVDLLKTNLALNKMTSTMCLASFASEVGGLLRTSRMAPLIAVSDLAALNIVSRGNLGVSKLAKLLAQNKELATAVAIGAIPAVEVLGVATAATATSSGGTKAAEAIGAAGGAALVIGALAAVLPAIEASLSSMAAKLNNRTFNILADLDFTFGGTIYRSFNEQVVTNGTQSIIAGSSNTVVSEEAKAAVAAAQTAATAVQLTLLALATVDTVANTIFGPGTSEGSDNVSNTATSGAEGSDDTGSANNSDAGMLAADAEPPDTVHVNEEGAWSVLALETTQVSTAAHTIETPEFAVAAEASVEIACAGDFSVETSMATIVADLVMIG